METISSTEIIKKLLIIGTYLLREGNRIVGDFNINQQQFVVLDQIVRNPGIDQKSINSKLLFQKSNTSKIVKKLQGLNYIEAARSLADSRSLSLSTTKEGNLVWEECIVRLNRWNLEYCAAMSAPEIEALDYTLEKLISRVQNP
jgi:DNA-binding MarR family transcriptional regulator